uniref:Cytochrome c oxidase subunit 3 n=1 Tax=Ephedra przewalskii TaxID=257425 RepID=A0A8F4MF80_9SPER|nr:cytochrome c oxidase subunit 3 [Ephedra przewalskii]
MVSQSHSYHLVDPSPWPIAGSLGALATTVGGVMFMHSFNGVNNYSVWALSSYHIPCAYGGAMCYVNPRLRDIIPKSYNMDLDMVLFRLSYRR